ncbi:MAG: DUF5984 family protein [Nannocystaceae bacterium]
MDSGHLRAGPCLQFWKSDAGVHAWCNNRERRIEGHQAWANDELYSVVSLARFEREVASFRERLLAEMDERVRTVESGWTTPGVERDAVALREQHSREEEPWAVITVATDWRRVSAALAENGSG